VKEATGELPHFPESIVALKSLPTKFKWLRKGGNTSDNGDHGNGNDNSGGDIGDNHTWRNDWIATLKADIDANQ
jgi:hypothetical protein